MTPQFFFIVAAIYAAPHMTPWLGMVTSGVFFVLGVIWLWRDA